LAEIFLTQLSILKYTPHSTSAFALLGESRPIIIRVKMDEKTSISFIYPNLWAPTAGLLQGLSVMQQCVYQVKFRNVCEVKKRLVLVWSRTLSQWMEKASPWLCSHSWPTLQAILLQAVEKWTTG